MTRPAREAVFPWKMTEHGRVIWIDICPLFMPIVVKETDPPAMNGFGGYPHERFKLIEYSAYSEAKSRMEYAEQQHKAAYEINQALQQTLAKVEAELKKVLQDSECGDCIEIGKTMETAFVSRIEDLKVENAKLKAQLWVAKDNVLRTYDGLAERADRVDKLEAEAIAHLILIEEQAKMIESLKEST